MNGKMFMFAKVSLISFVYDVIDVFTFPNEHVKDVFAKNDIIKCHLYLILTNTDSASIFFVLLSDIHCSITFAKARGLIYQIWTDSKLLGRLDFSIKFWVQFHVHNPSRKSKYCVKSLEIRSYFWSVFSCIQSEFKKIQTRNNSVYGHFSRSEVGLYEVESVDNANMITTAVNTKEYFAEYRSRHWNKKHKGMRKDFCGMTSEAFASWIMALNKHETAYKNQKRKTQKQFQAKNGVMRMNTCHLSLNDKRYYLSDGIVAFPFGHTLLQEVKKYKKDSEEKLQKRDREKQLDILNMEVKASASYKSLNLIRYWHLTSIVRTIASTLKPIY